MASVRSRSVLDRTRALVRQKPERPKANSIPPLALLKATDREAIPKKAAYALENKPRLRNARGTSDNIDLTCPTLLNLQATRLQTPVTVSETRGGSDHRRYVRSWRVFAVPGHSPKAGMPSSSDIPLPAVLSVKRGGRRGFLSWRLSAALVAFPPLRFSHRCTMHRHTRDRARPTERVVQRALPQS
jgi:hypothetical protein